MARIGDYIQPGLNTYDPSPYLQAQQRATAVIGDSMAAGIGAVGDAIEDRKIKKDTVKTSKELAKAMAVLYPESAGALEPVIAQLDDEEMPLSERAALGAQIGEFINMGVQKSRDNALMNLQVQQLGLDERRVRIAEAMPQMEAAAAQSSALSENDMKVDQAIATAMATADAAKMAGVQLPEDSTSLLNQYLEAGNGLGALAAAEAQAKAIDKFITPQSGMKLTKIGGTDAAGMPVDIDAFVTPSGDLLDINRQPLNAPQGPATQGGLPATPDQLSDALLPPLEETRRTVPMPNMPTIGIRPSGTPTPRTPTQQALDETRLRLAEQEVKSAESAVSKEQSTKQASLANAQDAVALIDRLQTHPGFEAAVGTSLTPGFIPATDRKGAEAIIEQLKGQAFLNAIQQLRGLGALSDAEGAKLQQAAARLNADQSEADFKQALNEYKGIVQQGIQRLQSQTPQPAPAQSAADRLRALKR